MRTRKSTMVELVDELRKLPQTLAIKFMIEEALVGEYDDYKNEKYTCGKYESATRLYKIGTPEARALSERIKEGEFDEEADAEDKAMLKRDALAGGFNEAQCQKLFGL